MKYVILHIPPTIGMTAVYHCAQMPLPTPPSVIYNQVPLAGEINPKTCWQIEPLILWCPAKSQLTDGQLVRWRTSVIPQFPPCARHINHQLLTGASQPPPAGATCAIGENAPTINAWSFGGQPVSGGHHGKRIRTVCDVQRLIPD